MAIAPLLDDVTSGLCVPWGTGDAPEMRVARAGGAASAGHPAWGGSAARSGDPAAARSSRPTLTVVRPVGPRRQHGRDPSRNVCQSRIGPIGHEQRARGRVRRRRIVLGVVAGGLVTALALPLSALGGANPASAGTAGRSGTGSSGSTSYVVQPGDTLWSIANRLDPGAPRTMVRMMTKELGAASVVPGERIALP